MRNPTLLQCKPLAAINQCRKQESTNDTIVFRLYVHDISTLNSGNYNIALVCNGQIYDVHSLIIQ